MSGGWTLPAVLAMAIHGALALVPIEEKTPSPAPDELQVNLRLVQPPAARPAEQEPTPVRPTPSRKTRRAVSTPHVAPAPEPIAPAEEPAPSRVDAAPSPRAETVPTSPARQPTKPSADLTAYRGRVHRAVVAQQRYPRAASRRGQQGTVEVQVLVDAGGRLAEPPRVTVSSGSALLDEEAQRMVQAAAPFSPLPSAYEKSHATLNIPVRFSLVRGSR